MYGTKSYNLLSDDNDIYRDALSHLIRKGLGVYSYISVRVVMVVRLWEEGSSGWSS